jgi:YhcH/YjgK/YiaL family protein
MIIDQLANSGLYEDLSEPIRRAFQFLRQTDLQNLENGRYEIDGNRLYASVETYMTKPRESAEWEAHRRYVDLQYVICGAEKIGYAPLCRMLPLDNYDPDQDIQLFAGEGDDLTLSDGQFMILFPHDAHMPGVAIDRPEMVKKIVVKMAV